MKRLLSCLLISVISISGYCQKIASLIPYTRHSDHAWGYADNSGKIILDLVYGSASPFHHGFAFVTKNGKMGVINESGQAVSEFIFSPSSDPYFVNDSLVVLQLYNKREMGVVHINGTPLTEFKYNGIVSFHDGLCAVAKQNKYGFIDLHGKEVLPVVYKTAPYNDIPHFSEGVCALYQNGKYIFIDASGKQAVPGTYKHVNSLDFFCNGVCRVYKGAKAIFIDKEGKEVAYDEELYRKEMNKTIESVIYAGRDINSPRPHLDSVNSFAGESFYQGYVYKNYYDKDGNVVFTNDYGMISEFYDGIAIMSKDKKMGVINLTGDLVIDFKYGRIENFKNGIAKVWKSTGENSFILLGYIDRNGREYWTD